MSKHTYPVSMAVLIVAAIVALQLHYQLARSPEPVGTAQAGPIVEVCDG